MSILTTRRQLATAAAAAVLGAGPDASVPPALRAVGHELAELLREHAALEGTALDLDHPDRDVASHRGMLLAVRLIPPVERRLLAELRRTSLPGVVVAGRLYPNPARLDWPTLA